MSATCVGFLFGYPTPYRAFIRLAAIVFLLIACYVALRYLAVRHTARIEPREGEKTTAWDLTVSRRIGKRERVVCRVGVEELLDIQPITGRLRVSGEASKLPLYRYTDSIHPKTLCLLTVREQTGTVLVCFSADQRFLDLLMQRKEQYLSD